MRKSYEENFKIFANFDFGDGYYYYRRGLKCLGVHLSVCMNTNTFSGAYWVQKRGILFGYSKKDYY